ncbi:MAG: PH domain-containing protein [Gemmatimonadetes bacterium]|nr:PH domain-containing protein [Gemmatimonadota bacterium]
MASVYWIVPAGPKVYWFFIPIFIILLGVFVLLAVAMVGTQRSRIELHEDRMVIRGDLYGRTIPYARLLTGEARIVDLRGEPSLAPVSRRVGTGLPGYRAGWFRLRNGTKALVYVTESSGVLYIPTREKYVILFSAQQPGVLLAELKPRAGG